METNWQLTSFFWFFNACPLSLSIPKTVLWYGGNTILKLSNGQLEPASSVKNVNYTYIKWLTTSQIVIANCHG